MDQDAGLSSRRSRVRIPYGLRRPTCQGEGKVATFKKGVEDWLLGLAGTSGATTAAFDNIRKGRLDVAAEAFEDAERLYRSQAAPAEKIAEVMAYRAWCYAKVGRGVESVELYREALALEEARGADTERVDQLREHLEWARAKTSA